MTDLLLCIEGILSGGWQLLTGVTIPGTEITFAMLFVGLAFISGGFSLLSLALGVSLGGSSGVGTSDGSYGSRGSKKSKISAERSNDER